ncbi:MAG: HEAT repeat domain-containing protein, partial [Deltaproteobacteria bacterium]|nr:HEAT repeat domain-containing protein [Deltaproteobacteria bacterium]
MSSGVPTGGFVVVTDDRSKVVRQKAGEFTLSMVKAMLQTGYYSADHPAAKAVVEDLYGIFRQVVLDAPELTYVLVSAVDERGVMIEGLLPEPIEVAKTFRGVMGDHFCAKFHDYFLRNKIASFTIKRAISETEFESFAGMWVGWAVRSLEEQAAASEMSDELNRKGVFNVTVVGIDEVVGQQRHLVWPVRIALSRLRKDLSRLPMLKGADRDTLARLKQQVIADVVRPVSRPEMLRDLILNADLVSEGLRDVTDLEVESAIVAAISPKPLFATAQVLLDLLDNLGKTGIADKITHAATDVEGLGVLARRGVVKMLARLAAADVTEAKALLEASYERGLISLDILPDDIRRHIKAVEMTEKFLQAPDAYFRDFSGCAEPRTYLKYLNVFSMILPELVSRRLVNYVGQTYQILWHHRDADPQPFAGRQRFIEEALRVQERAGVLDDMLRLATATRKEDREGIELGISMFGPSAVPGIILMLAGHDDVSTRKAAFGMLHRIGPAAVPLLVDELRAHRHSWSTARNLISVLGDMQARDAVAAVSQYCPHPHAKVREECALSLAKILGNEAEPKLIEFLEDKDEIVVRRVIHLLARMHATVPAFLGRLVTTVALRSRKAPEPHEWLQVACLRALGEYEHVVFPDPGLVERTLCEIIRPPRLRRLLPGRFGVRLKTQDIQVLAAVALGAVGTAKSIPVLEGMLF